jgi:hypothetical protein
LVGEVCFAEPESDFFTQEQSDTPAF